MSEMKLAATTREERGRHVSVVRRAEQVPAVIYGHNVAPQSISADARAVRRIWLRAGRTHLVDLAIDGEKARKVLIRELQTNPRTMAPVHVDFFAVNLKEKLTADVPVVLVGSAPAVDDFKVGQLLHALSTLKIECLPQDLPAQLSVDISTLAAVDDTLLVRDLVLPDGVVLLHGDLDDVVVKIAPVRVQAAEDEAEAAAAAAAAPPVEADAPAEGAPE